MKRLDKLVSYVDENRIVADIGSDHGITAIKVYEEKNPKKVIATDISKPSLQKLRDKLDINNYQIETIVTDGLKGLSDIDQIIISGMGGRLIVDILKGNMELAKSAEKIITSPNKSLYFYRKWILDQGFEILEDTMVEDQDVIYPIIVIRYRGQSSTYDHPLEYTYGKSNINSKSPILIKQLSQDIERKKDILDSFEGKESQKVNLRKEEFEKELEEMEDLLCKLKN